MNFVGNLSSKSIYFSSS